LCWSTPTYSISFGGQSAELVADSGGEFHLRDDPGWRLRLKSGADNGDARGQYWEVQTEVYLS